MRRVSKNCNTTKFHEWIKQYVVCMLCHIDVILLQTLISQTYQKKLNFCNSFKCTHPLADKALNKIQIMYL